MWIVSLAIRWKKQQKVANIAYKDIEKYLKHFKETQEVINVEDIEEYRTKDIDLLWIKRNKW